MNEERNLYNAPEGATVTPIVLVVIENYWHRGATLEEAWEGIKQVSGITRKKVIREKAGYLVYSGFNVRYGEGDERNVNTYVDNFGSVNYHRDYPAVLIDSRKYGESHA